VDSAYYGAAHHAVSSLFPTPRQTCPFHTITFIPLQKYFKIIRFYIPVTQAVSRLTLPIFLPPVQQPHSPLLCYPSKTRSSVQSTSILTGPRQRSAASSRPCTAACIFPQALNRSMKLFRQHLAVHISLLNPFSETQTFHSARCSQTASFCALAAAMHASLGSDGLCSASLTS